MVLIAIFIGLRVGTMLLGGDWLWPHVRLDSWQGVYSNPDYVEYVK